MENQSDLIEPTIITVSFDEMNVHLVSKIERLRRLEGTSRSKFVREAIKNYVRLKEDRG
jgi:metal-responsive CopG/Arc/MetJ family transcriptional regulator